MYEQEFQGEVIFMMLYTVVTTPDFSPGKEIVNGKSSNGIWFDLQGRKLSGKPARGVYIEGGKKKAQ